MTLIFGILSIFFLVAVMVLGITCSVVSEKFFKQLLHLSPELKDSFPGRPRLVFGEQSRPLSSSRMKYLQQHRYKDISDSALRAHGRKSWLLLVAYAITFTAMLISALLWGYFRSNAS